MIGVPKPPKTEKRPRKWLWRSARPIQRSPLRPSAKAIPKINRRRVERKAKAYRKVIGSDFHKQLRYLAFQRSGGLCECGRCVEVRRHPEQWDHHARDTAYSDIGCWFTVRGGAPYKRFRSKLGELHHESYKLFGRENPQEMQYVQWVHKSCHQRIEAEHGTRRRFLRGGKA